jgi:class 3 adenylate cyclase
VSELEPRTDGNGAGVAADGSGAAANPPAPLQAIDHDTLTGRVLVVDDTPFNRQLLRRLLDRIGHVTLEAADGQAALDLLRDPATEPVDVILLDIVMPVMDGYETLAALKADEALRDVPVIVISGVDELDSVVRCIEMGAADYLPKTVDPAIIRARVAASLGQKRLRDQERALLGTIERQRSQLARFLSPQVAALVSNPDGEAMLAGHRREITALFCDLRNFTVFSETAEPEEVLGFLRLYHATLGGLVVAHDGTLEHFAGDGIMVFFNDPVLQVDHAQRAVQLAIDIRERFKDISAEWRRRGHVLEVGIGIATGYATMGRIGFEGRYDYGGVGNAIILASRLSGEAVAGQILMAARTFAALETIGAEPVGERQLKGFSRPMPVYAAAARDEATVESDVSSPTGASSSAP